GTAPRRRPSGKAKPELVVASARKPTPASIRAEPASHGFGITKGSPSWSARNTRAFSACVTSGAELGQDALAVRAQQPVRVGAGAVHDADRSRTELLEHPEPLHVRVRIGRDDRHRPELLVRQLLF